MDFTTISVSEGRKNLPTIIKEVDEQGTIYVFTAHGKGKVAMVDLELLQEFMENAEYGISHKTLASRVNEKRISFDELKGGLDV